MSSGLFLGTLAAAFEGVFAAERLALVVFAPASPTATFYGFPGARKLDAACISYGPLSERVAANRRVLVISSLDEVRERFPQIRQNLVDAGVGSLVVLPLQVDDRFLGTLGLMSAAERAWQSYSAQLFDAIRTSLAAALDSCLAYEQAQSLGAELQALLDVTIAVGRHLQRDELFGALAGCLRNLLEIDRFGIELPIKGDRLQGHLLMACVPDGTGRAAPPAGGGKTAAPQQHRLTVGLQLLGYGMVGQTFGTMQNDARQTLKFY